ncbi:unnamed protein product, partial [Phaeothamnion confervicola]
AVPERSLRTLWAKTMGQIVATALKDPGQGDAVKEEDVRWVLEEMRGSLAVAVEKRRESQPNLKIDAVAAAALRAVFGLETIELSDLERLRRSPPSSTSTPKAYVLGPSFYDSSVRGSASLPHLGQQVNGGALPEERSGRARSGETGKTEQRTRYNSNTNSHKSVGGRSSVSGRKSASN